MGHGIRRHRVSVGAGVALGHLPEAAETPVAAVAYHARTGGSASNGALMRTPPVALAHLGDDQAMVEAAIAVAKLAIGFWSSPP